MTRHRSKLIDWNRLYICLLLTPHPYNVNPQVGMGPLFQFTNTTYEPYKLLKLACYLIDAWLGLCQYFICVWLISRVFFYNCHRVKSLLLSLELSFRSLLQGRQTSKWQFYTVWQFKIKGVNYEKLLYHINFHTLTTLW